MPRSRDSEPVAIGLAVAKEGVCTILHGDIKIESAIAVVIGKGNAAAIGIQGNAQRIGYIGEMPVLIFVIQIGLAPICHIEIEIAIVVKITPYRASASSIVGEAQLRRTISEHAIALVCIEPVIRAKIGDKQIEIAIVVKIAPGRAKTRPFIDGIKTIFYGREARAIVAKEAVGTAICQKQIEVPIVVKIAPGGLNPTFRIPQPQAIGQFGKMVAIILIKAIRAQNWRRRDRDRHRGRNRPRPRHTHRRNRQHPSQTPHL